MADGQRPGGPADADPRRELRADCARCFGLCCVAPAFAASADFAIDKPAGRPCPNLERDFRCGIHGELRGRGFAGCAVFDCYGAGQRIARDTFGGRDWRRSPELAEPMFAAFAVLRQLHELLWYLAEALTLDAARPLHAELGRARDEIERLAAGGPADLPALDVAAQRDRVNDLLRPASELARAGIARPGRAPRGRSRRPGPAPARPARRRPARGLPDRGRPARRRPGAGRPDRGRPAGGEPGRGGPVAQPVRDPVPGQRRPRRRPHPAAAGPAPAGALAGGYRDPN